MTLPARSPLTRRQLFGGAITISLPSEYLDASDLRQIPDNQEVFLSPRSETSIVIEILAMVEDGLASTDLYEAIKFHFNSIAHDNSSLSSTILTPPPPQPIPIPTQTLTSPPSLTPDHPPTTPSPITLQGLQQIHKFSYDPTGRPRPGHEADIPDTVWIGVALWRCVRGRKRADLVLSVNVNLSGEGGEGQGEREKEDVLGWFEECVRGLEIRDWELFGDEE